jgi:uncharacterized protein (DUF58 family)
MPRPRSRALGLLGGAILLFFLGTNVQAGWLFVMAALLLGTLTVGAVLPVVAIRRVVAEVRAPQEAVGGQQTIVEVGLRNTGRGVRWSLLVADDHLEPVRSFVGSVRPGERVEVATLRTPRGRGRRETSEVVVRTSAPFGVLERSRRLPVEASTLVLPALVPVGPLWFVRPVATVERAEHASPRRGAGPDFLGIREYRPGDSMRHVHWPSTARHGTVMVREFEEERTRRLAIVLDVHDAEPVGDDPSPLDRVCTAAGSIALAAAHEGHGARLIADTPGPEGPEVRSRLDETPMLRWLAELEPPRTDPARPFAEVLGGLGVEALRGVETAVVVAAWWPGEETDRLRAAVRALDARVDRVVVVHAIAGSEVTPGLLAEVDRFEEALAGIECRRWLPGRPLEEALA